MTTKLNKKIYGVPLYIVISLIGAVAFAVAPRKVTIPTHASTTSANDSEGLKLLNGSDVTVNYSVTCFDKNGTQRFQRTGLSLAAKSSTTHGASAKCASGYNESGSGFANGMVACGQVSQANAATSCPANYNLCSYAQMKANAGTSTGTNGWVSGFSFSVSGVWSIGSSSSGNLAVSWSDTDTNYGGYGFYPSANSSLHSHCNNATMGSGGTTMNYCGQVYSSDGTSTNLSTMPAFCCPGTNAESSVASCAIEIDSSTPTNGYLQSPQFKGSAPF